MRVILGGFHSTVTPFGEQSRPQTVDEVLRCPSAVNGMTAPKALVSDEQIATVASIIEQRLLGQMASANAHIIINMEIVRQHVINKRTETRYEEADR